ncbi:MAG: pyridoxamine 5'-phosphate oxidase family protein [Geobacteraceae bacterium]|nr:pyridoxamine 5'-phosphate oxidase family protein [Geobacteraceae bacterium]
MGKQYLELLEKDREFASQQKVFFLASASGEEVNLAPKGEDCLLFLGPGKLLLLDYPGSSNRTGRDLVAGGSLTLMFCSFDDDSRVLRIFCSGEVVRKEDPEFEALVKSFPDGDPEIVRQVFKLSVRAVENSCGLSVPVMRFEKKRDGGVRHWAEKKALKARGGG